MIKYIIIYSLIKLIWGAAIQIQKTTTTVNALFRIRFAPKHSNQIELKSYSTEYAINQWKLLTSNTWMLHSAVPKTPLISSSSIIPKLLKLTFGNSGHYNKEFCLDEI